MDSTREGLYCKAMSIVSTVYGIMLWASSFPSPPPMQTTTREESSFVSPKYQFSFGISTLMYLGKEMPRSPNNNSRPRILHSNIIRSPLSLSSSSSFSSSSSSSSSSCSWLLPGTIHTDSSLSSWSSSLTGDLIGSESGVYTSPNEDILTANGEMERSYSSERRYGGRSSSSSRVKQRYEKKKEKGKYPPSIPSLARTGNLPGRSMPWVLTRHYLDGRLIFKMQKVKRREYFKADRSDSGRLVLKLVPFDDDTVTCCHHDPADHENNWPGEEIEDDLNLIEEEDQNNKTDSEEEEEEIETNGHVDVDHDGREDEVYEGILEKVVDGASHSQQRKGQC